MDYSVVLRLADYSHGLQVILCNSLSSAVARWYKILYRHGTPLFPVPSACKPTLGVSCGARHKWISSAP